MHQDHSFFIFHYTMFKIKIADKIFTVDEKSGEPMMQQLVAQGAEIIAACGGAGICMTCAFKPVAGEFTEKSENEKMMELSGSQRLACQCLPKPHGEIELT